MGEPPMAAVTFDLPEKNGRIKKSVIVFQSKESKGMKKLDGSYGYFQDPNFIFYPPCCFLKVDDSFAKNEEEEDEEYPEDDVSGIESVKVSNTNRNGESESRSNIKKKNEKIISSKLTKCSYWISKNCIECRWMINQQAFISEIGFGHLFSFFSSTKEEERHQLGYELMKLIYFRTKNRTKTKVLSLPMEYPLATPGYGVGYHLHQVSRKIKSKEFWDIQFLESIRQPFILELQISAFGNQKFVYTIDGRDLRSYALEPPLAISLDPFGESSDGNLFTRLAYDLVWDPEYGQMQIDAIEIFRLKRKSEEEPDYVQNRQIEKLFDEQKIERTMRDLVTRQNTLWEQGQYQSIFPEDDKLEQNLLNTQTLPLAPPMRKSNKAIIDRAESFVVTEFTAQSHRKVTIPKRDSKILSRFSTFQSFNEDEDVFNDSTHEELPEDNFVPYTPRENVETKYLLHENTRIAKLIKDQNEKFQVRYEVYLRNLAKSGADALYLETLRYGEDPNNPNTDADTDLPILLHLREALKTPPERRLQEMTDMIIKMLMNTPGLSEFLRESTPPDINAIAGCCSMVHVSEEEILALREESIDCCFIVLKGTVYTRKVRREDIGDRLDYDGKATSSGKQSQRNSIHRHHQFPKIRKIQEFSSGKFVGSEFWRGRKNWKYDVFSTANTTLCIIPIHSLTRYVGYMGQTPQDILQCFWKFHGIFSEVHLLSQQLSVLHNADIDLTREYTERGHMRGYRPGERIFSQGFSRNYLYILTLGECEYSRSYPEPNSSLTKSQNCVEINIGLVLSAGHFSFMDGCLEDQILFHEDEDERGGKKVDKSAKYYELLCHDETQRYWGRDLWHIHTLHSLDEPTKRRIISKRKEFVDGHRMDEDETSFDKFPSDDVCDTSISLFGVHANSLTAKTYCEVCVLPLKHIYHCPAMFNKLLQISQLSYSLAAIPYDELLKRYHDTLIWEIEKREILADKVTQVTQSHTKAIEKFTSGHKSKQLQRYLLSTPRYWNTEEINKMQLQLQKEYGSELEKRREEYWKFKTLEKRVVDDKKRTSHFSAMISKDIESIIDSNFEEIEEQRSFFTTQDMTPFGSESIHQCSSISFSSQGGPGHSNHLSQHNSNPQPPAPCHEIDQDGSILSDLTSFSHHTTSSPTASHSLLHLPSRPKSSPSLRSAVNQSPRKKPSSPFASTSSSFAP